MTAICSNCEHYERHDSNCGLPPMPATCAHPDLRSFSRVYGWFEPNLSSAVTDKCDKLGCFAPKKAEAKRAWWKL